jgi:HD-like signal output (HDOD) protein/CheY-like chemotaxis protein
MVDLKRRRILFVDDEVRVLEGIQRMLRPMRNEWEVLIAEGGAKALEVLSRETVDVVVSDMRMPGMDGAELLQQVMSRHPNVVRIILSGQADRDSILRSLSATHQYLAKPCDPDRLRAAVAKACALRDLLHDEKLQRLVACLGTVPSLPGLYQQIQAELRKEEPSARRVGEIVAQDMGMSVKLLQLVNSARFGMNREVNSAIEAVGLIGIGTVKSLVLGAQLFTELNAAGDAGLKLDWLWKRATMVATLSGAIAKALKFPMPTADMAFTAGLLHDCGMLLLAVNRGSDYLAVTTEAEAAGLCNAERARFSADHAAVGAYLMGLWALPEPIVEAVAFHHRPSDGSITVASPLVAVHLAAALVDEHAPPPPMGSSVILDTALMDRLALTPRLPEFRDLVGKEG